MVLSLLLPSSLLFVLPILLFLAAKYLILSCWATLLFFWMSMLLYHFLFLIGVHALLQSSLYQCMFSCSPLLFIIVLLQKLAMFPCNVLYTCVLFPFIYVLFSCSPLLMCPLVSTVHAPLKTLPESSPKLSVLYIFQKGLSCFASPFLHADSFLFYPFSLVFFCQVFPPFWLKMLLCQSQF